MKKIVHLALAALLVAATHTATAVATWNSPAVLSAGTARTSAAFPSIASDFSGGNIVAVWAGASSDEIKVARSTDSGVTWAVSTFSPGGTAATGSQPHISTHGDGTWRVVWVATVTGGYKIKASSSTNNGSSWGTAVDLSTLEATATGLDHPRIASGASSTWGAIWCQDGTDIMASINGGTAADIDLVLTEARVPDIAVDGAGVFSAIWERTTGKTSQIWRNRYASGSWGTASQLSATHEVVQAPAISTDGASSNSDFVAAWHGGNEVFGTREIVIANSTNSGSSFSEQTTSLGDSISVFPDVATDRSGTWMTVWQSLNDSDIFFSISTDSGATWATGAAVNADHSRRLT